MKRLLALAFTLAAIAVAQGPKPAIDNDQVRTVVINEPPHRKTPLHDHKMNRVMIYLQPGKQTIEYQDGNKRLLDWKAGEVKWSPASGMHVGEITTNNAVTIVEVELKKAGSGANAGSSPLDPLKVDPKHYKVEFENSQVRVVRVKIGPKEVAPMHEHSLNRVVAYITPQKFRVTTADGKVEQVEHKAGEVSWGTPVKHKEENLSDQPFEVLVVELKS